MNHVYLFVFIKKCRCHFRPTSFRPRGFVAVSVCRLKFRNVQF